MVSDVAGVCWRVNRIRMSRSELTLTKKCSGQLSPQIICRLSWRTGAARIGRPVLVAGAGCDVRGRVAGAGERLWPSGVRGVRIVMVRQEWHVRHVIVTLMQWTQNYVLGGSQMVRGGRRVAAMLRCQSGGLLFFARIKWKMEESGFGSVVVQYA